MTSLSWKTLSLLGSMLVIAIGLQAGGIKIMMSLNQPSELAAKTSNTDHAKSLARPSKPDTSVTDPPHLAGLNSKAEPEHTPAPAPSAESHSPRPIAEPMPMPVPAPALAPASNIPPPIELEPKASAETPSDAPHETPPAPSVEAATLTSRIPPPIELEAASANTLLEPDWLEARDPNHYTVQLYSGKDLDKLREIAVSESITTVEPKAYFMTPSRSGPWYSLVVGDYPDFNAAQNIATKIAAQSGSIKPWIRRFSEIQARMR